MNPYFSRMLSPQEAGAGPDRPDKKADAPRYVAKPEPDLAVPPDDYLWDGSGTSDPDIAALEGVLGALKFKQGPSVAAAIGSDPSAGIEPCEPTTTTREEAIARAQRDHRRRKNAWVMPALAMLGLFVFMAYVGWPMRPWGPGAGGRPPQEPADQGPLASESTTWEASQVAGAPVIGTKMLTSTRAISTNDWITTDAVSRAKLYDAGIGTVNVEPNSSVRVTRVLNGQHWFELAQGKIEATIHAPPKLFFVKTKSALAVDMGCAYTLETDDQGNGTLHVTMGWVELQREGLSVRVPRGTKCSIRAGDGPGTPMSDRASEALAMTVRQFDDRAHQKSPSLSVDALLKVAGEGDAVTLWHVLQQVEEVDRVRVLEKLGSIVPPPSGISKELLMKLDPTALDQWWNDIRFR